jgi:hypothetical protein
MFRNRNDERFQISAYLVNPSTIDTTERAAYYGGIASRMIEDCNAMIETMQRYQKKLYDRVQEIETAPYHHRVQLIREKRWRESKVVYHLIVEKVYDVPGIKPAEIQRTNYPGTERRQAIAAFEAYKKTHPGIEAIKDIEKGKWEK